MKNTVKVSDIIALAKQAVEIYNIDMNNGNYDAARMVKHRIDSYQSIIITLAVGACVDFHNKCEEIRKEIWGE